MVHRSTPQVYSLRYPTIPTLPHQQGARLMPPDVPDTELQKLIDQNLSQNEIARRTNIPRSTLRRRLQSLSTPEVHPSTPPTPDVGTPQVNQGTQPQDAATHIPD